MERGNERREGGKGPKYSQGQPTGNAKSLTLVVFTSPALSLTIHEYIVIKMTWQSLFSHLC